MVDLGYPLHIVPWLQEDRDVVGRMSVIRDGMGFAVGRVGRMIGGRSKWMRSIWMLCIACVTVLAPAMVVQARVAFPATPVVSDPGCEQLPAYFAEVNGLTAGNEGLAILKTVDTDVLALTNAQAEQVVASLDALLVAWDRITPPSAAEAWHVAQRDLFAWYRDMATDRGHLDHQRLINRDKTIVPALGRATLLGQQACGADVWNAAVVTAPVATPAG